MVERLKTVEINTEKCICRINGKDIDEYTSCLKIEYANGEWEVEMTSDKFYGANKKLFTPEEIKE